LRLHLGALGSADKVFGCLGTVEGILRIEKIMSRNPTYRNPDRRPPTLTQRLDRCERKLREIEVLIQQLQGPLRGEENEGERQ
jgi:hypothetical protein